MLPQVEQVGRESDSEQFEDMAGSVAGTGPIAIGIDINCVYELSSEADRRSAAN